MLKSSTCGEGQAQHVIEIQFPKVHDNCHFVSESILEGRQCMRCCTFSMDKAGWHVINTISHYLPCTAVCGLGTRIEVPSPSESLESSFSCDHGVHNEHVCPCGPGSLHQRPPGRSGYRPGERGSDTITRRNNCRLRFSIGIWS